MCVAMQINKYTMTRGKEGRAARRGGLSSWQMSADGHHLSRRKLASHLAEKAEQSIPAAVGPHRISAALIPL